MKVYSAFRSLLNAPGSSIIVVATLALASLSAKVAPSTLVSDAEIDRMLRTRVDLQKKATGIVVGVIDGKGRHISSYGTMSLEKKRPVEGKTVFEVGSITKVFTALLLSEMAQNGEVALDDPVAKYLPPDVHLPALHGRAITLADLATHTSGLPLRATNLASKNPDDPYAGYTVELLDRFVASFVPEHEAGTHYEYSNVGYGLLAQALSRRAGKGLAKLIRTRITAPLEMGNTGLALTPEIEGRLATGYSDDLKPAARWDFGALAGAGALHSTADDLLNLLEAFLCERKTPLGPAMAAMLKTRRPGGMQPANEIALAWNVFSDEGREIAWKNGSVGGYRAFLGYDAKAHRGVVALTNAQTALGADDIGLHLLDPNIPADLSVPKPHHEIAVAPAILDRLAGRYRYSPTDTITVTRAGDHLLVVLATSEKLELFAEGERDFFAKSIDVQITFDASPNEPANAAIWQQAGESQRGERVPEPPTKP